MSVSMPCPNDRSLLLTMLEDQADEALRAHIDTCRRCQQDLETFQDTMGLITPIATERPSDRVRGAAVSYARSQVGDHRFGRTRWGASAAAVLGVALAVLTGEVSTARLSSSLPAYQTPLFWTIALGGTWGLGAFLYMTSRLSTIQRDEVRRSIAVVCCFAVLLLVFPVPTSVQRCAEWLFGRSPGTQVELGWIYATVAGLYAAVPSMLVGPVRHDALFWHRDRRVALLVVVMGGPLLLVQISHVPIPIAIAAMGGLACGAVLGGVAATIVRRGG